MLILQRPTLGNDHSVKGESLIYTSVLQRGFFFCAVFCVVVFSSMLQANKADLEPPETRKGSMLEADCTCI